jgi:hypothetical protein
MYKLIHGILTNTTAKGVLQIVNNAFIPFDPANTDYQQFKKDISQGVTLNDPDGNLMSSEAITTFLGTLP